MPTEASGPVRWRRKAQQQTSSSLHITLFHFSTRLSHFILFYKHQARHKSFCKVLRNDTITIVFNQSSSVMKLLCLLTFQLFTLTGLVTSSVNEHQLDKLALRLINGAVQRSDIFPKALAVLDSFKSSPSCSRLALHGLISECESLRHSSDTEVMLDQIKQEYAARLALCEVSAAGAALPSECELLDPSQSKLAGGDRKQSCASPPCYERVEQKQVRLCLNSLLDQPQMWTSYSNSYQNVVYICQASRTWVEKGM